MAGQSSTTSRLRKSKPSNPVIIDSSGDDSAGNSGEEEIAPPFTQITSRKTSHRLQPIAETVGSWQSSKLGKAAGVDSKTRKLIMSIANVSQAGSPVKRAQIETNRGLKSKSSSKQKLQLEKKGKGSSSKPSKSKGSKVSSEAVSTAKPFKVHKVVVLPGGIIKALHGADDDDDDSSADLDIEYQICGKDGETSPNLLRIQRLCQQQLAIIDEEGIEFDRSWTHDEVEQKLQGLFPVLFSYLNDHEDVLQSSHIVAEKMFESKWLLCLKVGKKLAVVPGVYFPDGQACHLNARVGRAGFRESTLFLATRRTIAASVLSAWAIGDPITKTPPRIGNRNQSPPPPTSPGPTPPSSIRGRSVSLGKRKALFLSDSSGKSSSESDDDSKPAPKRIRTTRSMTSSVAPVPIIVDSDDDDDVTLQPNTDNDWAMAIAMDSTWVNDGSILTMDAIDTNTTVSASTSHAASSTPSTSTPSGSVLASAPSASTPSISASASTTSFSTPPFIPLAASTSQLSRTQSTSSAIEAQDDPWRKRDFDFNF